MYKIKIEKCKFYRCSNPSPHGAFCSDFCRDMHIDRNPVDHPVDEDLEEVEDVEC